MNRYFFKATDAIANWKRAQHRKKKRTRRIVYWLRAATKYERKGFLFDRNKP
jgi:hypothetical protein